MAVSQDLVGRVLSATAVGDGLGTGALARDVLYNGKFSEDRYQKAVATIRETYGQAAVAQDPESRRQWTIAGALYDFVQTRRGRAGAGADEGARLPALDHRLFAAATPRMLDVRCEYVALDGAPDPAASVRDGEAYRVVHLVDPNDPRRAVCYDALALETDLLRQAALGGEPAASLEDILARTIPVAHPAGAGDIAGVPLTPADLRRVVHWREAVRAMREVLRRTSTTQDHVREIARLAEHIWPAAEHPAAPSRGATWARRALDFVAAIPSRFAETAVVLAILRVATCVVVRATLLVLARKRLYALLTPEFAKEIFDYVSMALLSDMIGSIWKLLTQTKVSFKVLGVDLADNPVVGPVLGSLEWLSARTLGLTGKFLAGFFLPKIVVEAVPWDAIASWAPRALWLQLTLLRSRFELLWRLANLFLDFIVRVLDACGAWLRGSAISEALFAEGDDDSLQDLLQGNATSLDLLAMVLSPQVICSVVGIPSFVCAALPIVLMPSNALQIMADVFTGIALARHGKGAAAKLGWLRTNCQVQYKDADVLQESSAPPAENS